MSALAPIAPFGTVVIDFAEDMSAAEVAETYTTMLDDLAAMIENADEFGTLPGRVIVRRLGELGVDLDELTVAAEPGKVVRLANEVDELRRYAKDATFSAPVFRALRAPLAELHSALVDLVPAAAWAVSAR
ncbi:MAG TPA: hypothetical protein VG674_32030 [Amycolatopsis sp.]|nr:hypothetical protein [Amycolatopsis sp.]